MDCCRLFEIKYLILAKDVICIYMSLVDDWTLDIGESESWVKYSLSITYIDLFFILNYDIFYLPFLKQSMSKKYTTMLFSLSRIRNFGSCIGYSFCKGMIKLL